MKHSVLKRLLALLALCLALALCLSLAACSSSSGGDGEDVAEDDQIKAEAGGSVSLPEGFTVPEEAGRIATQASGDTLYGAFTLTNYNTTGYFVQNGSVTVTVQASLWTDGVDTQWTDGYFALWKQGSGETQYVGTVHFVADDTPQSYTFSGLEAGASYRLSFGYSDVPRYKLSGKFSVSGITGEGTAEEPVANE